MEAQKITTTQELREYLKGINAAVKDVQINGVTDEPGVALVTVRLTLWHYLRYKRDYKAVIQQELNKRAPLGIRFKVVTHYPNTLYLLGRGFLLFWFTYGVLASLAFIASAILARVNTRLWANLFFDNFIEYFYTIHSLSFNVGLFALFASGAMLAIVVKDLIKKYKQHNRKN